MKPVIEMRNITKAFPGVLANHNVNFAVMPGQIHALLGENGAGKTTLMSILAGIYQPDQGDIFLHGKRLVLKSPFEALQTGIAMIYQHFKLVPAFTVAENVILGNPRTSLWLNRKQIEREIGEVALKYGINIDPGAKISQLSIGERQRVEILRALHRGSEILIMDEPTTVLTPGEVKELFATLKTMAAQGKSIILITHKLNEALAVADQVTVLHKGEMVDSLLAAQVDQAALTRMMIGRENIWHYQRQTQNNPQEPVLIIENISLFGEQGHLAVNNVSLELRAGEILAIAGVAGNGQRELVEAVAGLRSVASGRILINGTDITNCSVRAAINAGIRLVPEDRIGMALVGEMGVADNLILRDYLDPQYGPGLRLDYRTIYEKARDLVEKFDIMAQDLNVPVRMMSGGNLQRLVLAREMSQKHKVILASYPTRGLDVAAVEAIFTLFWQERSAGTAILLIMEDLEEILKVADRVAVMYNGTLSPPVACEHTGIEEIGRLMAGLGSSETVTSLAQEDIN